MFSVQEVQLDTAEGPRASTLSRYVTFFCERAIRIFRAYCRIFRIFQQIARVAYFSAKLILSTAISVLFLFSIIIWLLGFVTSTIWLPTEWRHPCVRTPVEQDRVVGFRFAYFRRIFVFMRSAYLKIPHKLRCLLALPSFDCYTSANLQKIRLRKLNVHQITTLGGKFNSFLATARTKMPLNIHQITTSTGKNQIFTRNFALPLTKPCGSLWMPLSPEFHFQRC